MSFEWNLLVFVAALGVAAVTPGPGLAAIVATVIAGVPVGRVFEFFRDWIVVGVEKTLKVPPGERDHWNCAYQGSGR